VLPFSGSWPFIGPVSYHARECITTTQ
jgi:hypothetical protein